MNPTTKISKPSLPDRFFVKSIDDYETFPTMQQAIDAANERIQDCLCDGWDEEAVNAIEYGAIMGAAEMFDKRPDETGEFSYICNYQASPLQDPGLFASKGLGDLESGITCHVVTGVFNDILESTRLEIKDPKQKIELYAFITSMLLTVATEKGAE